MKTKRLIVICAVLLVAGCFPSVERNYHISAIGGKVLNSCASGGMGKAIEFQRSDAVIRFSVGAGLLMSISLPDGDLAIIPLPATALLSSSVPGESQILSAETYYYWYEQGEKKTQPINDPMVGISKSISTFLGQRKIPRTYRIQFYGTKNLPDIFDITPPAILINGKLVKLPKIMFQRRTSIDIGPINC